MPIPIPGGVITIGVSLLALVVILGIFGRGGGKKN